MSAKRVRFNPDLLAESLSTYPCGGCYRVAFSGGADSTALLLALKMLGERLGNPLEAVHINHGYHENAEDWQRHCAKFCERHSITLRSIRVKPDFDSGLGPEAELRQRRYAAFEELIHAGDQLLTAHHLDDQAETLLLNLMRGSGLDGLAGMPATRPLGKGMLVRPLLNFRRAELEAFLAIEGEDWIEDSGNSDNRLDRNFLRNQVIPLLRERWPAADNSLARSARHCREGSNTLIVFGQQLLHTLLLNEHVMDLRSGIVSDNAQLKLVLRTWSRYAGAPPVPASRLEEFCRQLLAAKPAATVEMGWQGWRIRRHRERLWLQGTKPVPTCPRSDWNGTSPVKLGHGLGTLGFEHAEKPVLPQAVTIQSRSAGQRVLLRTGAQHQSIKSMLREAGVPPWLRPCVPVMVLGGETLAVGDWAVSPRLREWLAKSGARLYWKPRDAALKLVRDECHQPPVETGGSLG